MASLSDSPEFSMAAIFASWVQNCQRTLPQKDYQSAKNFARAFLIWTAKVNGEANKETPLIDRLCYIAAEIEMFADEIAMSEDIIMERLEPTSKTAFIGKNCRSLVDFLIEHNHIPADRLESAQRVSKDICASLLGENRCKRASWVLYQQDNFYQPALGGQARTVALTDPEVSGSFTVLIVGENWVIARNEDDEGAPTPDKPIKIQVPRRVTSLLKPKDNLDIAVRQVFEKDYWVISSVSSGVYPGFIESAATDGDVAAIADGIAEMAVDENDPDIARLLTVDVPNDIFPEDVYTEEWFLEREGDLASDEDVGLWDLDDEDDEDEDEDDDEE